VILGEPGLQHGDSLGVGGAVELVANDHALARDDTQRILHGWPRNG